MSTSKTRRDRCPTHTYVPLIEPRMRLITHADVYANLSPNFLQYAVAIVAFLKYAVATVAFLKYDIAIVLSLKYAVAIGAFLQYDVARGRAGTIGFAHLALVVRFSPRRRARADRSLPRTRFHRLSRLARVECHRVEP